MKNCSNLDNIKLPPNLTVLSTNVFYNCNNLTNIQLSQNLKKINNYAIQSKKLSSLTIPQNVSYINESAFTGCTNLIDIDIDENNKYYQFSNGVLMKKDGTEICFILDTVLASNNTFEIPDGLISFNYNLSPYENITTIRIPKSLKKITSGDFFPSSLENIIVDDSNTSFLIYANCLYSYDKKTLIYCYSKDSNVLFSDYIEVVNPYAFRRCY